jgi:mono/diheme cytochrome c family protein
MSFHPGTGLVYIPAHHNEGWYRNDPESLNDPTIWKLGMNMDRFAQLNIDNAPTMTAHLKAWDPVAQKEVWRVDHVGYFNAGVLSTAGGLVFQGAGDGVFSAYDARDGTQIWSVDTTTGIIAAPISYSLDGVQYVAIATGWGGGALPTGPPEEGAILHHINEGRVLAFRLGGSVDLPRSAPRDKRVPKPPPLVASAEDVARGKHLYNMNCLVCHGTDLVSSLIVPDLRVMPREKHAAFDAIVRGGALETQGMPRFGAELSAADANAIRSYVTERAHVLYAEEGTLRGE